jgi:hypothetical protein
LERHLRRAQAEWLDEQIADYARRAAGSEEDLDSALEEVGLQAWQETLDDELW